MPETTKKTATRKRTRSRKPADEQAVEPKPEMRATPKIAVTHEEMAPEGIDDMHDSVEEIVLRHKRGCPKDDSRIESTETKTPEGVQVVVVRCCDCGEYALAQGG